MSWTDVLTAAAATIGPIVSGWFGHRRAKKFAATASQVRRFSRDAAFFVAYVLKDSATADAARLVDNWWRKFGLFMDAAGLDLTDAQEDDALEEARRVFDQLGQLAVDRAADQFMDAVKLVQKDLIRLAPTLKRFRADQIKWRARYEAKHGKAGK